MSDILDLVVPGSAPALTAAALKVREVTKSLTASDNTLRAIDGRSEDAWSGPAADAFRSRLGFTRRNLDEIRTSLDAGATALDDIAGELEAAKSKISRARQIAVDGNLSVTDTTIIRPASPGEQVEDAAIEEFNRKVEAWNKAVGFYDDARIKEKEAHSNLERELKKAIDVTWLEDVLEGMGIIPKRNADAGELTGWGLGLVGAAAGGVAGWKRHVQFGRFAPRGPDGRWVAIDSLSRAEWASRANSDKEWTARKNQAANYRTWTKAGKIIGRASGPLAFATSAVDTWIEDSDDPSLTTSERVGRATTTGTTTGAGAIAGGWAGAALGTALLPGVGTVIGGVIGGAIGGYLGSKAGDALKDWGGDAAKYVTGGVADAVDDIGDAASTLKFW